MPFPLIPTSYPIYISDGRLSFEKEDETFHLLHPDDSPEERTELHLFQSPEAASEFEAYLRMVANALGTSIGCQRDLTTPDGIPALFVKYYDEEHSEREILEFLH